MAKPSKPASKPVARTEVRNSPVPQAAPARPAAPKSMPPKPGTTGAGSASAASSAARPASKPVSQDLIARRAYEIWASGQGGSDMENWIRAERELRGV